MVDEPDALITGSDIDQINIFRSWHNIMYNKLKGQLTNDELISSFTEQEWDHYCMRYVSEQMNKVTTITSSGNQSTTNQSWTQAKD